LIEYRRGRFTEAKALFQEVLARQPAAVPALTALGRLELLDHNDAHAIELLERALSMNPSDAESTYQLGVLYDRNGRTIEGVKQLRRALTLRANYPDPHYHLGRIALERKDYKTAWPSWNWHAACCRTRKPSACCWGGSIKLWPAGRRQGRVRRSAAAQSGGHRARPPPRGVRPIDEAMNRRPFLCLCLAVCCLAVWRVLASGQGIATRNVKPAGARNLRASPGPRIW